MIRIKLLGLFILLLLAACQVPYEFHGTELPNAQPIPEVTLESNQGEMSLYDFKGQYTFVYFGYTFCPDVCPITLSNLKQVKAELGDQGREMAVVMITVDPERDTPEKLAEYVAHFDDDFVGLSGDIEKIDALGKPFGLYYEHQEGTAASGYLVNHTARTFLLNKDSEVIMTFAHQTPANEIYEDLAHLLKSQP